MVKYHQSYCLTHNNYCRDDVVRFQNLTSEWVQYIVFGYETAPSTGTPHLQGYIWTARPMTPQQVKRRLPGTVVLVPGKTKGPDYWLTYCSKEDVNPFHEGVPPTQAEHEAQCPVGAGKRTDLLDVKRKLDAGSLPEELMEDDAHFGTFAAHGKFFREYSAHKRRRTSFAKPHVTVLYGPTATNKTRYAFESDSIDNIFKWEPSMEKWFDGYCGQRTCIFDEFRGQLPFGQVLSLLDGYPVRVQVKGGSVDFSPKFIFLTSPDHPREWYHNLTTTDRIDQLLRRIDRIVNTKFGPPALVRQLGSEDLSDMLRSDSPPLP